MARDPEVEKLLGNGNMEQLAALVLNGEGRRLLGRQSGNPELQAFIDNVPTYMVKNLLRVARYDGHERMCMYVRTSFLPGKNSRRTYSGSRR